MSRPYSSSGKTDCRLPGSDQPRVSQEGLEVVQSQVQEGLEVVQSQVQEGLEVVQSQVQDDGIQVVFHEWSTNSRTYPQRTIGKEEKEAIPLPNHATKPHFDAGIAAATPNPRWKAFLRRYRIIIHVIAMIIVITATAIPVAVILGTLGNIREPNK